MVGDGISEIKERNTQYDTGQYRITPTLKPITLYILAGYIDMEEKEWAPVIDGKALQVIGWAEPAALDEVLPAPFDWSELDDGLDWKAAVEIMNKEYPLFIKGPRTES